jgi:ABC-type xylose transport system permease subunit
MGQQIAGGTYNGGIDLASLNNGMYFITISYKGQQTVKRFVKN